MYYGNILIYLLFSLLFINIYIIRHYYLQFYYFFACFSVSGLELRALYTVSKCLTESIPNLSAILTPYTCLRVLNLPKLSLWLRVMALLTAVSRKFHLSWKLAANLTNSSLVLLGYYFCV